MCFPKAMPANRAKASLRKAASRGRRIRYCQCSICRMRRKEDRKKGITIDRKKAPPSFSRLMRLWAAMASAKSSTTYTNRPHRAGRLSPS